MASIYSFDGLASELENLKKNNASFAIVNKNNALSTGMNDKEVKDVVLSDNFSLVKSRPNEAFVIVDKDANGQPKADISIYAYSTEGHRFRIDLFIYEKIKPGCTVRIMKDTAKVKDREGNESLVPYFTFMDVVSSSSSTKVEPASTTAPEPAGTTPPDPNNG